MGLEQHELRLKRRDIELWRYVRAMPEYVEYLAMKRADGYAIIKRTVLCVAVFAGVWTFAFVAHSLFPHNTVVKAIYIFVAVVGMGSASFWMFANNHRSQSLLIRRYEKLVGIGRHLGIGASLVPSEERPIPAERPAAVRANDQANESPHPSPRHEPAQLAPRAKRRP